MEKIEATYRIVTPMFIGGADQKPSDGIRPPSFKGVLRFWWRALNWGGYYKENNGNEVEAMKALHKAEAHLFGATAKKEGSKQLGGQSAFLLTVESGNLSFTPQDKVHEGFKPTKQKIDSNNKQIPDETHLAAARYLGYGVIVPFTTRNREDHVIEKQAAQLERGCINENQTFTVKLLFRDKIEDSIVVALKALGLLGSLGSRSRHGLGSIALESLEIGGNDEWEAPTNADAYNSQINKLFSGLTRPAINPPFSAFWKDSRIDHLLSADTCYQALDNFGKAMLDYRSWGQSGQQNKLPSGEKSEKRFDDDHNWFKNSEDGPIGIRWRDNHSNFHPERVAFGLPHNYGKLRMDHVISEHHERRSSPLFFHVHRLISSNNCFIGISIYLPAKFLPDGEKILSGGVMVRGTFKPTYVPSKVNKGRVGDVIVEFLDGKVKNPLSNKNRFQNKKPVLLP